MLQYGRALLDRVLLRALAAKLVINLHVYLVVFCLFIRQNMCYSIHLNTFMSFPPFMSFVCTLRILDISFNSTSA
jgi:hypothetical protein